MSGTATTPGARTRRGVRRPQSAQWTPVLPPSETFAAPDAPGADDVSRPAPTASSGPVSFRDLLGPVRTDAPAAPMPVTAAEPVAPAPGAAPPFARTPFTRTPAAPADAVEPAAESAVEAVASAPDDAAPAASTRPFTPTRLARTPFRRTPATVEPDDAALEDAAPAGSTSPFTPTRLARTPFRRTPSTAEPDDAEPDDAGPDDAGPDDAAPAGLPVEEAAPAPARRRLAVPRLLDRRLALVAAAVLALGAGTGAGAATDLLGDDVAEVAPTTPEQCVTIQAAWTASASSQVGMTADDPLTLRDGFLGARDALVGVPTPSGAAADWALVAAYLDTVADAVEPVDPADGEAITAAVGAAIGELDTPAATAASARVTAYLQGGCVG